MLESSPYTLYDLTMSHHPQLAPFLLIGITLAVSACATGPDLDFTIHESERGAVYLERIPNRSFQAAHPIMLSADTMVRVLRGVALKENRALLENLLPGTPESTRAFGDAHVEYLAPLLVEGLTRAASDQQVGFRVPQTKVEKGSLYAYGGALHLTLEWLIPNSKYGSLGPMTSPTIIFIPESAKRPDSDRDTRSTDATLVIDYNMLATMPAASDMQPTAAEASTTVKGKPAQRDTDLDALRNEVEGLKKALKEQELERTRSAPTPSPRPTPY